MLQINFEHVQWRHSPEVATILYSAFNHRTKHDLLSSLDKEAIIISAKHYGHTAGFVIVDRFSTDYWIVQWLAVAKCFRRWGVGTTILDHVCHTYGSHVLHVFEDNIIAQKFTRNLATYLTKKVRMVYGFTKTFRRPTMARTNERNDKKCARAERKINKMERLSPTYPQVVKKQRKKLARAERKMNCQRSWLWPKLNISD